MPQGLQIFNSAGQVTFDSSYGISRILGSIFVNGSSGNISIPFIGTGANKLAFWASNNFGTINDGTWPQLYITGNTLIWSGLLIPSFEFPREVIIGESTR